MELRKEQVLYGPELINMGVYSPDNWDGKTKLPVVVFLHGLGENGDGSLSSFNKFLTNQNHSNLLKAGDQLRFHVVAPQFVQKFNNWIPDWSGGGYVNAVMEWVFKQAFTYVNQVYLCGLSAGGGGVWDYITRNLEWSKRIAAAVPICGVSVNAVDWKIIANSELPVWAFHAKDDKTVGVGATTGQVQKAGSTAKATIYDTGGHGIWGKVFNTPELYEWMLSKKRNIVPEIPIIPVIPDPEPEIPAPPKRLVDVKLGIEDGGLKASLSFSDGSVQEVK